jgi:hypothetical protein
MPRQPEPKNCLERDRAIEGALPGGQVGSQLTGNSAGKQQAIAERAEAG